MRKTPSILLLFASALLLLLGSACTQVAQARELPSAPPETQPADAQSAKAWLGLALAPLTERLAQRLGITERPGLVVLRVMPGGPAGTAGVQQKDVVVAMNGGPVSKLPDIRTAMESVNPGDQVGLTLYRGDSLLNITVTAAAPPAPGPGAGPGPGHRGKGHGRLGLPELQDIPQGERFDHLLSRQTVITDKDNKQVTYDTIFGKVVSASDTSLTYTPNGKTSAVTVQITSNTRSRFKISELKAGDKVGVTVRNSSSEAFAVIRFVPRQQGQPRTQGMMEGMPGPYPGMMEGMPVLPQGMMEGMPGPYPGMMDRMLGLYPGMMEGMPGQYQGMMGQMPDFHQGMPDRMPGFSGVMPGTPSSVN
ncbi:MAG: PDZ domain-containing protein [Chloroflexi bacterium]|nr:PDZ domain-containing protein [Chloroflexota bacterium]